MLKVCLFTLTSLVLSSNAFAKWELLNDESSVNYVSVKNSSAGEVNGFKSLSGSLEDDGKLSVEIDLGSVDTNVAIRDDRMKTVLFEVASFAKANISAAIDLKLFTEMNIGDSYNSSIIINLSLHGVSKELATDVRVVKLSNNRILAVSEKPVILSAADYNLAGGVEKLQEIAKLSAISKAVPVTFSLVFSQQ